MKPNTTIVEFIDPDLGTIYIEMEDKNRPNQQETDNTMGKPDSGGWGNINNAKPEQPISKVEGKFSDVLASLKRIGKGTFDALQSLHPDEVELKTSVKFSLKEGKLIGLLAQAETEGNFEVTIKWKLKQTINPEQA